MTDPDPHAVDPGDEERHLPSDEPLWNESHYLDVVSHDGRLAAYARIGLYPNLGVAWWTAMVVGPDRPLVASVAYDLPVPPMGLGLHAPGYALDTDIVAPLDRVQVHGTAPAAVHADAADVYRGGSGTPTTLAIARSSIVPTMAFAMPPPDSPVGFGSWVKKLRSSELQPCTRRK